MTKTELKREIETQCGQFPTMRQMDAYLHKRKGFTRKLMQGIEPWKDGRSLRYYAGDVAERIVECWL